MVFLPKLLGYLRKVAPGASARVWPIPLDKPAFPLSSGDVDLAVGYFDNLTTGFRQSFLFRDRYVCVVRAMHPKFAKGMTAEAFQNAEHAMAHSTGMAHANIDQLLARYQVQRKVALNPQDSDANLTASIGKSIWRRLLRAYISAACQAPTTLQ
jgi:DNA-binding transcriptional LysR family regulator